MNDDLRAALDADSPNDEQIRTLLRAALGSRASAAEGDYCSCAEPELAGRALMCFRCHKRNKDQERAKAHELVDPHAFVPGPARGLFCAVCVEGEPAPRHHGVPAECRTSWGEVVHGSAVL